MPANASSGLPDTSQIMGLLLPWKWVDYVTHLAFLYATRRKMPDAFRKVGLSGSPLSRRFIEVACPT